MGFYWEDHPDGDPASLLSAYEKIEANLAKGASEYDGLTLAELEALYCRGSGGPQQMAADAAQRAGRRQPSLDAPADLYRMFDAEGALLYVGISMTVATRLGTHRGEKQWWPAVATIRVEHLPTRREALKAEEMAIKTEHPLHNGTFNQDRPVGV